MIQRRLAKAGLSKQTAKGSAATAATYAFGVGSGSVAKLDFDEAAIPMTWSTRDIQGHDRTAVKPGADLTTVATPSLIGLLLFGALGADAVTGAGPYTHVITPATTLPYLTQFGTQGSNWLKTADSKLSDLELSWEAASRLSAKATLMGCTPSFLTSAYTETNQELLASVGYFDAAGGTFTIEGNDVHIDGGTIKIDNKVVQQMTSALITPIDVVEGERDVVYTLKFMPDDLSILHEIIMGASGNNSPAVAAPYYGAVSLEFIGPTTDTLTITSPHVEFKTPFPDADPAGGPVEVTLTGQVAMPAAGASTTVTLVNAVATY